MSVRHGQDGREREKERVRERDSLLSVRHRQDGRERERERDSLSSVLDTDRMAERERE